ncbi:MAG: VTT domain-containing protein [Acidobacteriota bacterium]
MGRFHDTLVAWGPLGIFAAALIESLGVPNPGGTDALILLVCIAQPSDAWLCAVLAILGSLIGSFFFHQVVSKGGEKLLAQRTATPRGAKLRVWFERYGLASVFVCALVPIPVMPLKVMALSACALGVSRWRYLGVMMAARVPRYFGVAYLGAQLGENSNAWLKAHLWHMGIGALLLFAALFGLLKITERRRAVTEL